MDKQQIKSRLLEIKEELISMKAQLAESKTQPYARKLPAWVDVFKTTIAKHYRPTEDFHEGSIRVVKPEPSVLVYMGCLSTDNWDGERCSPNPTILKTIVPRIPKYEEELEHLKLVHPEIKVTRKVKEISVEPQVGQSEEDKELKAVEEAVESPGKEVEVE